MRKPYFNIGCFSQQAASSHSAIRKVPKHSMITARDRFVLRSGHQGAHQFRMYRLMILIDLLAAQLLVRINSSVVYFPPIISIILALVVFSAGSKQLQRKKKGTETPNDHSMKQVCSQQLSSGCSSVQEMQISDSHRPADRTAACKN